MSDTDPTQNYPIVAEAACLLAGLYRPDLAERKAVEQRNVQHRQKWLGMARLLGVAALGLLLMSMLLFFLSQHTLLAWSGVALAAALGVAAFVSYRRAQNDIETFTPKTFAVALAYWQLAIVPVTDKARLVWDTLGQTRSSLHLPQLDLDRLHEVAHALPTSEQDFSRQTEILFLQTLKQLCDRLALRQERIDHAFLPAASDLSLALQRAFEKTPLVAEPFQVDALILPAHAPADVDTLQALATRLQCVANKSFGTSLKQILAQIHEGTARMRVQAQQRLETEISALADGDGDNGHTTAAVQTAITHMFDRVAGGIETTLQPLLQALAADAAEKTQNLETRYAEELARRQEVHAQNQRESGTQISSLSADRDGARQDLVSAEAGLTQAEQETQLARQQVEELQAKVEQLKVEAGSHRDRLQLIEREMEEARQEVQRLTPLAPDPEEFERLRREEDERARQLESLCRQIQEKETALPQSSGPQNAVLRRALSNLKGQEKTLRAAQTAAAPVLQAHEQNRNQLTNAQTQLANLGTEESALRAQLDRARQELNERLSELPQARTQLDGLEQTRTQRERERDAAQARLATLEEALQAAQAAQASAAAAASADQQRLAAEKQEALQALEQEIEHRQREIRADVDQIRGTKSHLIAQLQTIDGYPNQQENAELDRAVVDYRRRAIADAEAQVQQALARIQASVAACQSAIDEHSWSGSPAPATAAAYFIPVWFTREQRHSQWQIAAVGRIDPNQTEPTAGAPDALYRHVEEAIRMAELAPQLRPLLDVADPAGRSAALQHLQDLCARQIIGEDVLDHARRSLLPGVETSQ